ncbi:hypothetical protein GX48_08077, partial [Paracoccidioides brasiliensis]
IEQGPLKRRERAQKRRAGAPSPKRQRCYRNGPSARSGPMTTVRGGLGAPLTSTKDTNFVLVNSKS